MKKVLFPLLLALVVLIFCCNSPSREAATYHIDPVEHAAFYPNTLFQGSEDLDAPKFAALKKTYQLDTIFHGEQDEFKRILLLRHWIRSHIPIDNVGPYPGDGSPESILNEGMKGHGFHCGHYMRVQNAIMNAYGYVTRCLGAGPGIKGADSHHGINEVWLNSLHKWFMSDAKYDAHFEKAGVPLSALEIREEYLKNGAKDIQPVIGPNREPLSHDSTPVRRKELTARTYTWIEWDNSGSLYTNWPADSSVMIMYADDYFNTHQWIWDGKPHWAYHTIYMRPTSDRHAIEWTPNTITADATVEGNRLNVRLHSQTPNLQAYQLKESPEKDWETVPDSVSLTLQADKQEFAFRTLNKAGVAGIPYRILVSK
jgi:hypothetical protein